ncbi:MAG: hypothetical protein M3N13_09700 [Candidatus Eremiobacteraeota bacterium]|nr:hypothetical protein [Candidatus Eremiobacteraeota bacterium]
MAARPGFHHVTIAPVRGKRTIKLYTSMRVIRALKRLKDEKMYTRARVVATAVYEQGLKDGAAAAFDSIERSVRASKKAVPHKSPGRPRKPR